MKYVAVITYTNGTRTGAIIHAESHGEAWEKLFKVFNPEFILGVKLTECLTETHEIK